MTIEGSQDRWWFSWIGRHEEAPEGWFRIGFGDSDMDVCIRIAPEGDDGLDLEALVGQVFSFEDLAEHVAWEACGHGAPPVREFIRAVQAARTAARR